MRWGSPYCYFFSACHFSDESSDGSLLVAAREQRDDDDQRQRDADVWNLCAGHGECCFQSTTNRIFVRFKDAGNVTRGSTSVAVTENFKIDVALIV